VKTTTFPLLTEQFSSDTASQKSSADVVPVAVYSVSLAGGWDEDNDFTDSIELDSDVDVDIFVVDHLLATAQAIVDCGVLVLACQKVRLFVLFFIFFYSGMHH